MKGKKSVVTVVQQDRKASGIPQAKKQLRECTKEFLFPDKHIMDDSYISTAVVHAPNGVRAGFSLHDGQSSVVFKCDFVPPPVINREQLKRFDTLMSKIIDRLEAWQTNVHKAVESMKS